MVDINADDPTKDRLLCVEVRFHGKNREKHQKRDTVHYAMCECVGAHSQDNEECVCTLAAFYGGSLVDDDDYVLQQTRSSLKHKPKASQPYFRRVMWRDPKNHLRGNYLSLIRKGSTFFKNLASDLDRDLELSCSRKVNPDSVAVGNRAGFTSHSWKRTGSAVVERKYGDDPTMTLQMKMRLANQKQPSMYSMYAEDGKLELLNAVRLKKRMQLRSVDDKENVDSNVRGIRKEASIKKKSTRRRQRKGKNGRKCEGEKGGVETEEDCDEVNELLSKDDERESVVKIAKYGLRGGIRRRRQKGFYAEDKVQSRYKGHHSNSASVSKKRHRPY